MRHIIKTFRSRSNTVRINSAGAHVITRRSGIKLAGGFLFISVLAVAGANLNSTGGNSGNKASSASLDPTSQVGTATTDTRTLSPDNPAATGDAQPGGNNTAGNGTSITITSTSTTGGGSNTQVTVNGQPVASGPGSSSTTTSSTSSDGQHTNVNTSTTSDQSGTDSNSRTNTYSHVYIHSNSNSDTNLEVN